MFSAFLLLGTTVFAGSWKLGQFLNAPQYYRIGTREGLLIVSEKCFTIFKKKKVVKP